MHVRDANDKQSPEWMGILSGHGEFMFMRSIDVGGSCPVASSAIRCPP